MLLEWTKAAGPIIAASIATLGVCATIWWNMRKGKEDARFAYAGKALDLRLRQLTEFYAPLRLHIEQSRILYEKLKLSLKQLGEANPALRIPLDGFRLLDHTHKILNDSQYGAIRPIVQAILDIGDEISLLISKNAALAEGGLTQTLITYRAHLLMLKMSALQPPSIATASGNAEPAYYPRMLNREIAEGYKEVLRHFEVFQEAGDEIAWKLLGRIPESRRKAFRDLLANLQYYESNVEVYAARFDGFDLSELREHFTKRVNESLKPQSNGSVNAAPLLLDAGCGTGRDTAAFIQSGFQVTAFDISPAMVRLCNRRIRGEQKSGIAEVAARANQSACLELSFDELNYRNHFDCIWASASLLHVPKAEFSKTVQRLVQALKPRGILFMSFKYGNGEAEFDSRHYSYFTPSDLRAFLANVQHARVGEVWMSDKNGKRISKLRAWWKSSGHREGESTGLWVNVLVEKQLR